MKYRSLSEVVCKVGKFSKMNMNLAQLSRSTSQTFQQFMDSRMMVRLEGQKSMQKKMENYF